MSKYNYSYFSLEEKIKKQQLELEEMSLVLEKYPDAELASYNDEFATGVFSASSVKNDKNLTMGFWGDWYDLHVKFFTEIPFNSTFIKIYGKPIDFNLWQIPHGIFLEENPCIVWNNIDKILSIKGYDKKFLKIIYNELLDLMNEPIINPLTMKNLNIQISNKEDMPKYILNYLPFM